MLGHHPRSRRNRCGSRRRLIVEPLEERALLSTWIVNDLGDAGTGSGTSGDLRYCITQANRTTGDNTINFSVTGTITLNSALPDLSNTTGRMDIEGPGAANLTVARSPAPDTPHFRIFTIDNGAEVAVGGLEITGGRTDNAEYGGGILLYGDAALTVAHCVITHNSASGDGGGISGGGTLTVIDSTINGNSAAWAGGIMSGASASTVTLINSTVAGNSCRYTGGGIFAVGSLNITNSTVAYNSCGGAEYYGVGTVYGGGIYYWGPTRLNNTIVALNTGLGASDIVKEPSAGSWTTLVGASNLIGTGGSGGLVDGVGGNQVGVADPGLAALSDNGGLTPTIALEPGSKAIDGGSNALAVDPGTGQPLVYDQRGPGYSRVNNGTVDIGAFEVQSASHLAVTAQPPGSVTAGSGFGLTITAYDKTGSVMSAFDGAVTVALSSSPGGATLGGTATENAQNGVATFSGLMLDKAAAGYTLVVTASGIDGIVTNAINVTPAPATKLVVTSQPPTRVFGGIGFGLSVTALDPYGNVDTNLARGLTAALAANPGGATLGGTLTLSAQNGVTTFSGLTLDKAGAGYTLQITGSGLTGATTSAIEVVTATQLAITAEPSAAVLAGSAFRIVATAEDQYGDAIPNYAASVTVSLSANPGGATLGGTLTVSAQSGLATFSGLTLDLPGLGCTLLVSSDGLTAATTRPFNVQTSIASSVGVKWGTARSATLDTSADGLRLLSAGRNTDVPWLGINRIQINLAQAANLTSGDVTVIGSSGTNYGADSVSGSGTGYTITLAQAINGPDRVTITIGNALIANFTRRLDVLPGDFNDDGVVNSQDLVGIRNQIIGYAGALPTIFGDINGDGVVDINDYTAVRTRLGTHL
jgi:hypothetical protein